MEVFISHVSPSGSQDGVVTEDVSVTYKDVEFAYKPQDDKGAAGGDIKFGWNIATNETR
jgi:type VI secretion system secreted protein Hcp